MSELLSQALRGARHELRAEADAETERYLATHPQAVAA